MDLSIPLGTPNDEPQGLEPVPEPTSFRDQFATPHQWYAFWYGRCRQDSLYNSLMKPSEVPADWTLQDRIRAYITLKTVTVPAFTRTDSREF